MKPLREIVPVQEGIIGDYASSLANKFHNYQSFRFRAPSARKFTGISGVKRKIKTGLGINFVQRWTSPNRIKQRVYGKLGIYHNSLLTRWREFKKGKLYGTFMNMRPDKSRGMNFGKLKATEQKARPNKPRGISKTIAFKPKKQPQDVTKL